MKRQHLLTAFLAAAAVVLTIGLGSCGEDENVNPGDPTSDDSDSQTDGQSSVEYSGIFTLPSSIAESSANSAPMQSALNTASTKSDRSNNMEMVRNIFNPVREYVGICNEAAEAVKNYIEDASTKSNLGEYTVTYEGEVRYLVVTNATNSSYTRRYEFYKSSNKLTNTSISEVDLASMDKGKVFISSNYSSYFDGDVEVDFDGSGSEEVMKVKLVGWAGANPTDKWAADNMYIEARKSGSNITLSGSSYHPRAGEAAPGEMYFNDGKARCYTFTAKVDEAQNRTTVNLSLPEADTDATSMDTTNFFASNSFASVYKRRALSVFRKTTNIDFKTVGAVVGVTDIQSNEAMTIDQFRRVIDGYYTNSRVANTDVNKLKFIFSLDNPVYFDENGFVTNGASSRSGFPGKSAVDSLSLVSPNRVKSLRGFRPVTNR